MNIFRQFEDKDFCEQRAVNIFRQFEDKDFCEQRSVNIFRLRINTFVSRGL